MQLEQRAERTNCLLATVLLLCHTDTRHQQTHSAQTELTLQMYCVMI